MGSLKEAAKIFVPGTFFFLQFSFYVSEIDMCNRPILAFPPIRFLLLTLVFHCCYDAIQGGATVYSARTIKIKEDEDIR